jgi:hypothetical protein
VTYRRRPFKSNEPNPKHLFFGGFLQNFPKETVVLVVVSKLISHFVEISHKKKIMLI